jgi:hypothetical protein
MSYKRHELQEEVTPSGAGSGRGIAAEDNRHEPGSSQQTSRKRAHTSRQQRKEVIYGR